MPNVPSSNMDSNTDTLEPCIEAFEAAWCAGKVPAITDYLATDPAVNESRARELLLELVVVDMEHRWRVDEYSLAAEDTIGFKPRLATYAENFARLGPIAELPAWVMAEEYRVRHVWGDRPNPDRFIAEYPAHLAGLVGLLPLVDRELTADHPVAPVSKRFSPAESDPRAPLPHTDYLLEQHLGTGGMGKVYRATQRSLQRPVAIKALLKSRQEDAIAVDRFVQEARIVGKLNHPNIVGVHGLGRFPGGGYFLVMDLVEGQDLATRQQSTTLPVEEAIRVTCDVAKAIQYAHDHGVIHCDLKPANVLLDSGDHVFVTDFGLAQLMTRKPGQPAGVGGTAGYMAPEQLDLSNNDVGPTTDIYGLGAFFYSLLTGQPPGVSNSDESAHGYESARVRPSALREDVPEEVDDVCAKCLQRRPGNRYQHLSDVIAALSKIQTE